ncbi:MAG: CoA transferase [Chloroflexi bacterium]|nr:CoA transferase [Chloroflexota bacterium]
MLGILDDVRLIELSHHLTGAFCAKLLADQGADTIKVEPPGRGDAARHEPPFLAGPPHPNQSSQFLAFNTNKRSITLNLETRTGQRLLQGLVRAADVIIDSFAPGYLESLGLGYETLHQVNPRLILTSITPFGQTGPYRHYLSSDLVEQALGGALIGFGDADKEPMALPQNQTAITAGRNAAIATMAALLYQRATGEGQHIDVSIMEAVVQTPPGHIHQYSFAGNNVARGAAGGQRSVMDGMHLETQDGYVTLTTAGTGGADAMDAWADFLELPELKDPKFKSRQGRTRHWEELRELVVGRLRRWKSHEFFKAAMERRLVVGVVQSPAEVVDCPHLAERGSFMALDHPDLGILNYPGAGFLADGENPVTGSRPAPRLGEHNREIYTELLGLSQHELAQLTAAGVI